VTKICESFAGGLAPVAGDLDYPEQSMQRVLHVAKVLASGKVYWRFISGFGPIRSNLSRSGQPRHYMQTVQSRINTGNFASC
jgi:hypothetical protein